MIKSILTVIFQIHDQEEQESATYNMAAEEPPISTVPATSFTFQMPCLSNTATLPNIDFTFQFPRPSAVLQALEDGEATAHKMHLSSTHTKIVAPCLPLAPINSIATTPPARLAVPSKRSSDTAGLYKFWTQETPAARLERDHREFEVLRRTNELRQLADERAKAVAKAITASDSWERVRKHRAARLALRVASGFKPNQKRVSLSSAADYKTFTHINYRNI